MIQKQAPNLKRPALFTENERSYLRGKSSMSRTRKSKFLGELDFRFDELLKDLELIRRSENLRSWRNLRSYKYSHYFLGVEYFSDLFSDWERSYPDIIHRIRKRKQVKYWLELVRHNDRIDDRMFKSEFLTCSTKTSLNFI